MIVWEGEGERGSERGRERERGRRKVAFGAQKERLACTKEMNKHMARTLLGGR